MPAVAAANERLTLTPTAHTTTASARPAVAIYGAIAIVLFAFVAFFAHAHLPLPYKQGVKPADYSGPSVLEGWVRFDAGWYRSIAEHGYYFRGDKEQSSVAFFPVYPLVMRGLHSVFGGDTAAWGIFITLAAGTAGASRASVKSVLATRWPCSCCGPMRGTCSARSMPTRSSSR
ncbi:MAG: hypothetical protein E6G39_02920 [Actinobacteria bacterium]|nr:MAG: hypothetical protein E6G39_02920 [Actinomycetota bacterium]